ncbi:hypothetical protein NEOLEDRAFT_1176688 [Neolentinus lepideus HHB14362 ss-1]|uniref:Uncharacterized protein n=1 Tax=Neolentinus lepideus HHB14362 ss-1 TaxID=1314782 RepID=A0A165U5S5_9AGAM|nr:hypothetical protein NEOLEDRAFT_1176688 [Neolentinus lepideus HHB14362 ss-1]
MPAPRNVANGQDGPTRLISILAVVLGCVGILLSMIVYWASRIIPALKMKMPESKAPLARPACATQRRTQSSPGDIPPTASKSVKRVSFSIDDARSADSSTSPRSSFSSERSGDCSFTQSSKFSDPFTSSCSSATSTIAGLFSSDKPSSIRIPNILKPKRLRSGSESSAASSASSGSPTPAQRTASSASASTIRPSSELRARSSAAPRTPSRSPSRTAPGKEVERARPRSLRAQSIREERISRLKRVSEDSGEMYYSGWENPLKFRRRSSRSGSSRKMISEKVLNIFSGSCNDQSSQNATSSATSDDASSVSVDTRRTSVSSTSIKRSKTKTFMHKFVPLSRTNSRGSKES